MTIGESIFLSHVHLHPHHLMPSSSNSTPKHEKAAYFVREPLGKRPAPGEDVFDNGPKAKRRFERVNSMLGDFSISKDDPFMVNSSSDEDMEEPPCDPTPGAIVEEPDDPAPSGIQLDHRLKGFLERAKQSQQLLPPSANAIRGNELIVWRPLKSVDPFDDPQMNGRIQEVTDDGDELEEGPGSMEVSTPTVTDEEMSVDSERGSVPLIQELSDDDSQGSPLSSDDGSMDMEF